MRVIYIESEEDYQWLRNVVDRAHARSWNNREFLHEVQFQIKRVSESINAAVDQPNETAEVQTVEPAATLSTRAPKKKASRSSQVASSALRYCEAHPVYQAKRSPRTDCTECWAAYTQLNPTKASTARRKFERNRK